MNLDAMVRPCGGGYAYCNGHCTDCDKNNYEYSNSTNCDNPVQTNSLVKPTVEQYEASKKARKDLSSYITLSKKHQEQLLDELLKERCTEKEYRYAYEQHQDLIRRYEIYEELGKLDN